MNGARKPARPVRPIKPLHMPTGGNAAVKVVTDGDEADLQQLSRALKKYTTQTKTIEDFDFIDPAGKPAQPAAAKLGSGGYGVVYRMVEKSSSVPVAVKVMEKSKFCMSEEVKRSCKTDEELDEKRKKLAKARYRLIIEIAVLQMTSQDKDENLLSYMTTMQNEQSVYIVMELFEAYTLHDHLAAAWKQRRGMMPLLPKKETIIIATQLLQTLQHLHRMGIIHRDVKLENVLLKPDTLALKLIDFGQAKYTQEKLRTGVSPAPGSTPHVPPQVTGSPQVGITPVCGTALYLPWEALDGMVKREEWYCSKSQATKLDIYACGMIMFIMLCGPPQRLMPAQTAAVEEKRAQMMDVLGTDYLNTELDHKAGRGELVALVKRMLSPDKEQRPTTEECLAVLNRIYPVLDVKSVLSLEAVVLSAAVAACIVSDCLSHPPAHRYVPPVGVTPQPSLFHHHHHHNHHHHQQQQPLVAYPVSLVPSLPPHLQHPQQQQQMLPSPDSSSSDPFNSHLSATWIAYARKRDDGR